MAEQWDLLNAFAGEGDPYIDLAEEIFGRKISKKDPERSVGKQGMLSFQYGVGWRKYLSSVRVGTQGPPYELEEDQAVRAVQAYRAKYTAITGTWRTLDQALDRMTVPGCNWEPIPYVRFEHRRVRMPNKLRIYYPGLDGMDYGDGRLQYEYQSRHGPTKIYGGAFFENLVQSVARTIVAEQALEIAKRYPDVVLLVHDEVLFLAPEEEAEDALRFSLDCLATPPKWCEDLPLGAEGYISDFYKK
jgi:DNA polymerase